MKDEHKAKCFTALLDAARQLEELSDTMQSANLTFTALGVKVVLFRAMPDGSLAHVDYLMAWEEIFLTKFNLLTELIIDMHSKLIDATPTRNPLRKGRSDE